MKKQQFMGYILLACVPLFATSSVQMCYDNEIIITTIFVTFIVTLRVPTISYFPNIYSSLAS